MKYYLHIFLFLAVCFIFSCKRKSSILIAGAVDSLDATMVRVTNADFTIAYDSTFVINNSFKINIELPENGFYKLDFSSKIPYKKYPWTHSCLFYADNKASYSFKASGPSGILQNRYNFSSNSETQNKLNEFYKLVALKRDTIWHQKMYYLNLSDQALAKGSDNLYRKYLDTVSRIQDYLKKAYLTSIHQYIPENKNTLITPYLISGVPDLFERYTFYKKALDDLSPAVKQTKYYDEANGLLQAIKNLYIGAHAPPIYGQNGNEFKVNYAGKKVILIDFWASYCAPCRQQIPDMKKLYGQYKNKGFDIISVSIDEDPLKWGRASKQDSISWHNIAELADQSNSKNVKNFVVKSIPANYILNNKGELIGRNVGLDSLEKMLRGVK
jgi:thiol-disulfide isomerase/thioredoxin